MRRILAAIGILVLACLPLFGTPTGDVGAAPPVVEYVNLNIQEDQSTNASLYVWDITEGAYALDYTYNPPRPIDGPDGGFDHQTSIQVVVPIGHCYTVWLLKNETVYYIKNQAALPTVGDWTGVGTTEASGCTPKKGNYNIHFSSRKPAEVIQLTVIKLVDNTSCGSASPDDWMIYVKDSLDADISGSPQPGDPVGTTYVLLAAGTYTVSETGPGGYTASFNPSASVSLSLGDDVTVTVTNTAITPTATASADALSVCVGATIQLRLTTLRQ